MSNESNCLLLISSNLPKELIDIIFTYLRPIQLVFLNKFWLLRDDIFGKGA